MEEIFSGIEGGIGGRIEPAENVRIAKTGGVQVEAKLGEFAARDFGSVMLGTAEEVLLREEADDAAGSGASCASGALGGRGAGDALDGEAREPGPGRVRGNAREAGVDDGAHAFDGDGGLGDVCGEDDLSFAAGEDGAVLLVRGEIAVEGEDSDAGAGAESFECALGAADFSSAGEEDEDVAFGLRADQARDGLCDEGFERVGGVRGVFDLQREEAAITAQDRAVVEELGDGLTVESRRHDDEAEVRARGGLQAMEQGEGEVAFEVALVEFVKDDGGDAVEFGVREETAGENTFGEEAKAGVAAAHLLEADLIADGTADGLATLFGDAARGQACGEAAGLEDEDLTGKDIEEGSGHTSGFACAWRGLEDKVRRDAQRFRDGGEQRIHWQAHHIYTVPMIATLTAPKRLLFGPGPSPVHPRVYEAMSQPIVGHLDPYFFQVNEEIRGWLKKCFGTKNEFTMVISGTGSAGMECAVTNFVEPGAKVAMFANGYFSDRLTEMARRHGGVVERLEKPWGETYTDAEAREFIDTVKPQVVAFVNAETSTGAHQPGSGICKAAHEVGALVIADCVTSLGGMPIGVDEAGIDIAYSGTQKALGCPPGLAPITCSPRALEWLKARKGSAVSWYLDLKLLLDYYESAHRYHHTAPISMFYALREALAVISEEGLERRFARHKQNHEMFVAGLAEMGIGMLVKEGHRLWTLNTPLVPQGVNELNVRKRMMADCSIEIAGGLGPLAGKVFRIGTMGYGSTEENITLLLEALGSALRAEGR